MKKILIFMVFVMFIFLGSFAKVTGLTASTLKKSQSIDSSAYEKNEHTFHTTNEESTSTLYYDEDEDEDEDEDDDDEDDGDEEDED